MRRHPPPAPPTTGATSWGGQRNRSTQHHFRTLVLRNANYQCQYMQGGVRCPTTYPLQAHHTQPHNDDPTTGVALCPPHHKALDPHAR